MINTLDLAKVAILNDGCPICTGRLRLEGDVPVCDACRKSFCPFCRNVLPNCSHCLDKSKISTLVPGHQWPVVDRDRWSTDERNLFDAEYLGPRGPAGYHNIYPMIWNWIVIEKLRKNGYPIAVLPWSAKIYALLTENAMVEDIEALRRRVQEETEAHQANLLNFVSEQPSSLDHCLLQLAGVGSDVKDVHWSPDSRLLAIATTTETTVWAVPEGRRVAKLKIGVASPEQLAFSQDGSILSVRAERTISRWNTATWKLIEKVKYRSRNDLELKPPLVMLPSPNRQELAKDARAAEAAGVKAQLTEQGKVLIFDGRRIPLNERATGVTLSEEGRWCAARNSRSVWIFERHSDLRVYALTPKASKGMRFIAGTNILWIPGTECDWLCSPSFYEGWLHEQTRHALFHLPNEDPYVFLYVREYLFVLNRYDLRLVKQMMHSERFYDDPTIELRLCYADSLTRYPENSTSFSTDGKRFMVHAVAMTTVFDLDTCEILLKINAREHFAQALLSPNGNYLVTSGSAGTMIWKVPEKAEVPNKFEQLSSVYLLPVDTLPPSTSVSFRVERHLVAECARGWIKVLPNYGTLLSGKRQLPSPTPRPRWLPTRW